MTDQHAPSDEFVVEYDTPVVDSNGRDLDYFDQGLIWRGRPVNPDWVVVTLESGLAGFVETGSVRWLDPSVTAAAAPTQPPASQRPLPRPQPVPPTPAPRQQPTPPSDGSVLTSTTSEEVNLDVRGLALIVALWAGISLFRIAATLNHWMTSDELGFTTARLGSASWWSFFSTSWLAQDRLPYEADWLYEQANRVSLSPLLWLTGITALTAVWVAVRPSPAGIGWLSFCLFLHIAAVLADVYLTATFSGVVDFDRVDTDFVLRALALPAIATWVLRPLGQRLRRKRRASGSAVASPSSYT